MNITINGRLEPFSHLPGSTCFVPGTTWKIQAFPICFVLTSETGEQHVISLPLHGPVRDFTLLQNLERGSVAIFGNWQEGFFYWQIECHGNALQLSLKRAPDFGCVLHINGQPHRMRRKDIWHVAVLERIPLFSSERLSLGSHKKQEWEGIYRRMNMEEILPIWFRLGQLFPSTCTQKGVEWPTPSCKEEWPEILRCIFCEHFRNMFMPTIEDDLYQGLLQTQVKGLSSPLMLLQEGAGLIRSLFFVEEYNGYAFLPSLPAPWHCGRFTGITTKHGDKIDLEWSKKQIRRLIVYPAMTRSLVFRFPSAIKSLRVRNSLHAKGKRQESNSIFSLSAHEPLYLDRFEK